MVDAKSYIGKIVEVKIDRPIGSSHPKYHYKLKNYFRKNKIYDKMHKEKYQKEK